MRDLFESEETEQHQREELQQKLDTLSELSEALYTHLTLFIESAIEDNDDQNVFADAQRSLKQYREEKDKNQRWQDAIIEKNPIAKLIID